jgi:hypothetical protein
MGTRGSAGSDLVDARVRSLISYIRPPTSGLISWDKLARCHVCDSPTRCRSCGIHFRILVCDECRRHARCLVCGELPDFELDSDCTEEEDDDGDDDNDKEERPQLQEVSDVQVRVQDRPTLMISLSIYIYTCRKASARIPALELSSTEAIFRSTVSRICSTPTF